MVGATASAGAISRRFSEPRATQRAARGSGGPLCGRAQVLRIVKFGARPFLWRSRDRQLFPRPGRCDCERSRGRSCKGIAWSSLQNVWPGPSTRCGGPSDGGPSTRTIGRNEPHAAFGGPRFATRQPSRTEFRHCLNLRKVLIKTDSAIPVIGDQSLRSRYRQLN
jgi:hypothetical protein